MSKGPSSAGNITQTTVNPTQQAQLPFLQQGWGAAQGLFQNNPLQYYPGTTLAPYNPNIAGGYNNTIGAIPSLYNDVVNPSLTGFGQFPGISSDLISGTGNLSGQLGGIASDLISGSGYLSNQFGDMSNAGTGALPYAGNIAGYAGSAASNPYSGALGSLANGTIATEASGGFLGKNPYIDAEYQAAANPVVRSYMTATAPQTDSNFEAAGRYGSGAQANRVSQNQQDLSAGLGNLSANLYGQDYANERSLMQQAQGLQANTLNAAGNQFLSGLQTGITGQTAAGNLTLNDYAQRLNALQDQASTYLTGKTGAANALQNAASDFIAGKTGASGILGTGLGLEPSLISSAFAPSNAQTQAGLGLTGLDQQTIQDAMNRFYGTQNAPYQTLSTFLNNIGQPTSGSQSITTPLLGPNPLSSLIGTAGGLNSLFGSGSNSLFGSNGMFGSGGLFGGLFGGASAAAALPVTAADAGLFADGLGLGGTGLDAALSFLPFGL